MARRGWAFARTVIRRVAPSQVAAVAIQIQSDAVENGVGERISLAFRVKRREPAAADAGGGFYR